LRGYTLIEMEISLLGMWYDCVLLQMMVRYHIKLGDCQSLFGVPGASAGPMQEMLHGRHTFV